MSSSLSLKTANGGITLSPEDGLGNIDVTIPRVGWVENTESVTGAATFVNSTQLISMIGIGGIKGLELGDVVQVSGSNSNDTEYTVEGVIDSDNIVVNYGHRGQTTNKALTDESLTSDVTVKLLCKWYNAPIGLGQGWCSPEIQILSEVSMTSPVNRTIEIAGGSYDLAAVSCTVTVNGLIVSRSNNSASGGAEQYIDFSVLVASESIYTINLGTNDSFNFYRELR